MWPGLIAYNANQKQGAVDKDKIHIEQPVVIPSSIPNHCRTCYPRVTVLSMPCQSFSGVGLDAALPGNLAPDLHPGVAQVADAPGLSAPGGS